MNKSNQLINQLINQESPSKQEGWFNILVIIARLSTQPHKLLYLVAIPGLLRICRILSNPTSNNSTFQDLQLTPSQTFCIGDIHLARRRSTVIMIISKFR